MLPLPCPPFSLPRSDGMSATHCRYLRGASGPLGRPMVAISACRRGSRVIVSAALVSACCCVEHALQLASTLPCCPPRCCRRISFCFHAFAPVLMPKTPSPLAGGGGRQPGGRQLQP